jgi:hypothetical protein
MNYLKLYMNLIYTRGRSSKPKDGRYYERHHIIPKSHGGGNQKWNLCWLTLKEHFVAHWLLWKIYRSSKMVFALNHMNNRAFRRTVLTNRLQKLVLKELQPKIISRLTTDNPMLDPTIAAKISGDNHYTKDYSWRRFYSESRKGKNNPCYGRVNPSAGTRLQTPLGVFPSIKKAAEAHNVDPNTVYRRLDRDPEEWYRLPRED